MITSHFAPHREQELCGNNFIQTFEKGHQLAENKTLCTMFKFNTYYSHPLSVREDSLAYLNSIFLVGDEVDACLHSGISALSQYLLLQSVDICGTQLDKLTNYLDNVTASNR